MSLPPSPTPPAATDRPAPAADVTAYQLDDDLVLYDARTAEAHVLNLTAAAIWQLCDGRRSLEQLTDAFSNTFALDRDRATADVAELVAGLQAAGLLTMV